MTQTVVPRRNKKKSEFLEPHEFEEHIDAGAFFEKRSVANIVSLFNQFRQHQTPRKFIIAPPSPRVLAQPKAKRIEPLQEEVSTFVLEHNLQDSLEHAEELINRFVPGVLRISGKVNDDDDGGDGWIKLLIHVTAKPSDVLEADDALLDAWIDNIPHATNDLIRFDYKFVR